MLILDALKSLCKKATTKDSVAADISGTIKDMAENWPGEASSDIPGFVKQGAAVPDAAGETPTKEEFNALLASLRNAGIIAGS